MPAGALATHAVDVPLSAAGSPGGGLRRLAGAGRGITFCLLGESVRKVEPEGRASSKCVPTVEACFVRRKGEYGLRWPGAVYDGEAALTKLAGAGDPGDRPAAERQARPARRADLHARRGRRLARRGQTAASPTGCWSCSSIARSTPGRPPTRPSTRKIPTVVFSPVGSSFTTNTAAPSKKTGCFICSTDDFRQVRYGMKMLQAGAKMRATRCLVIAGKKTADARDARTWASSSATSRPRRSSTSTRRRPESDEVQAMAKDLMAGATRQIGATQQDVLNGIKSYVVARTLLGARAGRRDHHGLPRGAGQDARSACPASPGRR